MKFQFPFDVKRDFLTLFACTCHMIGVNEHINRVYGHMISLWSHDNCISCDRKHVVLKSTCKTIFFDQVLSLYKSYILFSSYKIHFKFAKSKLKIRIWSDHHHKNKVERKDSHITRSGKKLIHCFLYFSNNNYKQDLCDAIYRICKSHFICLICNQG